MRRKGFERTNVIFACFEWSRRRVMARLPLDIEDNPLGEMIKSGRLLRKGEKAGAT